MSHNSAHKPEQDDCNDTRYVCVNQPWTRIPDLSNCSDLLCVWSSAVISFFFSTGLLSDTNTVGSLNWMDKRCGNKQARAECGDEREAEVPRSPSESKDTNTKETVSSDLWSLYSCVLYGLPHLTLVAQTTA